MLDQGSQVPLWDLHLPKDLRELHCNPEEDRVSEGAGQGQGQGQCERRRREVRTKEAQEVVRPVQVGGGRELVLQRVVVRSELPAQHLKQTREGNHETQPSGRRSGAVSVHCPAGGPPR